MRLGGLALTLVAGSLAMASLLAKPGIRDAFFEGYRENGYNLQDGMLTPPSLLLGGTVKLDCLICHWDPNGGGPKNPMGDSVKNEMDALGLKEKDTAALAAAIWGLRNGDPDADGHTTFTEVTDHLANGAQAYVNTPTFPGLSVTNVNLVDTTSLQADDITWLNDKLVPEGSTPDITPPLLSLISPDGGESLTANLPTTINWNVSDDESGVAGVDIYLSLDGGSTYTPIAYLTGSSATSGTYTWHPANRPSTQARILLFAIDQAGNSASDVSDAAFSIIQPPGGLVPTTLRDFDMPGTQPLENKLHALEDPTSCSDCHGGYDTSVEPYHNWRGSMMSMASIDFMFEANMVIANQDAPESGDLCLRCHNSQGWLGGRSTPTDGSRMTAGDLIGVSCDLCHRMVDPDYQAGISPEEDFDIIAALRNATQELTNANYIIDPIGNRRGPFEDTVAPHSVIVSPFHRTSELCATCHDVSNPAFVRPVGAVSGDEYEAGPLDLAPDDMSPETLMPVERTYSEWKHSAFNSPDGRIRPAFAGNKADQRVASCQDCHMRDVSGYGANPSDFPGIPERPDMPLHDMTGGSTWVPYVLASENPGLNLNNEVSDGIARARYMLQNAARLEITDNGGQLKVRLINMTGHKLPTGYPEGRRMWINLRYYDAGSQLIAQHGAYDPDTAVLTSNDTKVYENKPGIGPGLAADIRSRTPDAIPEVPPEGGPSFHFVLNNKIYKDNRIPPEGFTNAGFETFGGAPVGATYADGQYWDDTWFEIPSNAERAEVRIYFQSVSKEFIEFLRDENTSNTLGDEVYALWETYGKAPPELMTRSTWQRNFTQIHTRMDPALGHCIIEFMSVDGVEYTIRFADHLTASPLEWKTFENNGTITGDGGIISFIDDFTTNTSGSPSSGQRFYKVSYEVTVP